MIESLNDSLFFSMSSKVWSWKGDNRIVFIGLQRILEKVFYKAITHEEIDETKRFLAHAKVTTTGFQEYEFPEEMWRKVVDEFNGRPPIKIRAVKEGSIIYPNEPAIEITSAVDVALISFSTWIISGVNTPNDFS